MFAERCCHYNFPDKDSSILARHLLAFLALLLFSVFAHATDQFKALDKEFDAVLQDCAHGKLHCAAGHLKHLRSIGPASGPETLQEHMFRVYLAAWMLHRIGENQDAEIEYKLAFDLSKGVCDHVDARTCAEIQWIIEANYAQLSLDDKRYGEAQVLLLNAQAIDQKLAISSSTLDDHLVFISTMLGEALAGLGKFAEAEKAYLRAKSGIEARPSDWARTHWEGWVGMSEEIFPDQLTIRMAALHRMEGDNERALKLLGPILGPEHGSGDEQSTDIADACDEAALVYAGMHQDDMAEPLLQRAFDIRTHSMASQCAVSWRDAEKLGIEMQGLARACHSDECRGAGASLAALTQKIAAASHLHPYVLHENLCE